VKDRLRGSSLEIAAQLEKRESSMAQVWNPTLRWVIAATMCALGTAARAQGCDNGVPIGGSACKSQGDSVQYVCQSGSYPGASIWQPVSCNGGSCQGASCTAAPSGCDNGVAIGGSACKTQGDSVEYVCQSGSHPGASSWSTQSCNGGTCQGSSCTSAVEGCDNGVPVGGTACKAQGDGLEYVCQQGSHPGASIWSPLSCGTGTCQGNACTNSQTQTCSALAQSAISWETQQLATQYNYADLCLGFVYGAYKAAGETPYWLTGATAAASLATARADPAWVPWNGSCPCGAVVYWESSSCNGFDGHVAICTGDGSASSSGWYGKSPWPGGKQTISWLSSMECAQPPAGYLCPDGACQGGTPTATTCDNDVAVGATACNQSDPYDQYVCAYPGQPSSKQWITEACPSGQTCQGTTCKPVQQKTCETIGDDFGTCTGNASCAWYDCAASANKCQTQGADICQVCPGYDGCSTPTQSCETIGDDFGTCTGNPSCAWYDCAASANKCQAQGADICQVCPGYDGCGTPTQSCETIGDDFGTCTGNASCAWYDCAASANKCQTQGADICQVCPGYDGCGTPTQSCETIGDDFGTCTGNASCAWYDCAASANKCQTRGADICQVCPGYSGCGVCTPAASGAGGAGSTQLSLTGTPTFCCPAGEVVTPSNTCAYDLAQYAVPSCDTAKSWATLRDDGSAGFWRFVPLGVSTTSSSSAHFIYIKSPDAWNFEEYFIDNDAIRLWRDTSWAYQDPPGSTTWCDEWCGSTGSSACKSKYPDPTVAHFAYMAPRDQINPSLGAVRLPRYFDPVGQNTFKVNATITGASDDACAPCSSWHSGSTTITSQLSHLNNLSSPTGQTYTDVILLEITDGAGKGEKTYYARGYGWIGFESGTAHEWIKTPAVSTLDIPLPGTCLSQGFAKGSFCGTVAVP
jgi:hypothetical protein